MARTLNGLLDVARKAVSAFGDSPEATLEAIRALKAFGQHTHQYRNKYKSQPKVRKAILTSGEYADTLARLLDKVCNLPESPENQDVVKKARVRVLLAMDSMSLSGYDENGIFAMEQWLASVRDLLPVPTSQPSQLADILGQP